MANVLDANAYNCVFLRLERNDALRLNSNVGALKNPRISDLASSYASEDKCEYGNNYSASGNGTIGVKQAADRYEDAISALKGYIAGGLISLCILAFWHFKS